MSKVKRHAKSEKLRVRRIVDVPLREVSGICLRRCRKHSMTLVAVGDRTSKLAWTPLPRRDDGDLDWHIIDIARLEGSAMPSKHSQIEAVCADGKGRVLLLQESPARIEVVDVDASKVVASIDLVMNGRGELARSWNDSDGSRGEGAVLLAGGRLLIAKEKHPATLIEFGPARAKSRGVSSRAALAGGAAWPIRNGRTEFVPLAVWQPDTHMRRACEDFSDLEIGPDGRLYVLSDQSCTIARIEPLSPGGGTATISASWNLEDLDEKPEGLSFTADGRAVIALDKRKRRKNLAVFEPAIAPPARR